MTQTGSFPSVGLKTCRTFGLVTHVPGAHKHGDHVRLGLLRVFVLHLLKQLAETFSLLVRRQTKDCTFKPTTIN